MPLASMNEVPKPDGLQNWTQIMHGTSSPLKIFALTVLICTTIFASAAAVLGDPITFMYCIHMFLGLVGMFSLIALWCPASLYHPKELRDIPDGILPKNNRIGPTLSILAVVLIYTYYQYKTPPKILMIPKGYSVYDIADGKLLPN